MDNLAVHRVILLSLAFLPFNGSGGIKRISAFGNVPFVFGQSLKILGVDDSIFAPAQSNPSEGVTETGPPIQKHNQYERPLNPCWNLDQNLDDFHLLRLTSELGIPCLIFDIFFVLSHNWMYLHF